MNIIQELKSPSTWLPRWLPLALPPFLVTSLLIVSIWAVYHIAGETYTVPLLNHLEGFIHEALILLVYFSSIVLISLSFLFLAPAGTRRAKFLSWLTKNNAHAAEHYVAFIFGLFPPLMIAIAIAMYAGAFDKETGGVLIISSIGLLILISVFGSFAAGIGDLNKRIENKVLDPRVKPLFERRPGWFKFGALILGLALLALPTWIALQTEKIKVKVGLSVAEYDRLTAIARKDDKTIEELIKATLKDYKAGEW